MIDFDLEQIYRNYSRKVFCYLLSLGASEATAEDLVQDTFLKAAQNIEQFRHESTLSSWLCSIARNLYRDWLRKQKTMIPADEIEIPAYDRQRDLQLFSCLHQLDEPYREIVYLRNFAGMSFREIGEIFSRTETWSRVNYFRGKQKLKEMLKEEERYD